MNWIRQEKRLAIYLRDGCACVWCGLTVEEGAQLSLDHLVPHSKGGSNDATNLVTACKRCNDSRGNRSSIEWSRVIAAYLNHGVKAIRVLRHAESSRLRPLAPFLAEAKRLIALRGSAFAVLSQKGRKSK
jgi:hypothetical protein